MNINEIENRIARISRVIAVVVGIAAFVEMCFSDINDHAIRVSAAIAIAGLTLMVIAEWRAR